MVSCHVSGSVGVNLLLFLLGSKKLEITGQLSASARFSCPMNRSNASSPHSQRCQSLMTLFPWRRRAASRICWGPKSQNRNKSGSSGRWAVSTCLSLKHCPPYEVEPEWGNQYLSPVTNRKIAPKQTNIHWKWFCSDLITFLPAGEDWAEKSWIKCWSWNTEFCLSNIF